MTMFSFKKLYSLLKVIAFLLGSMAASCLLEISRLGAEEHRSWDAKITQLDSEKGTARISVQFNHHIDLLSVCFYGICSFSFIYIIVDKVIADRLEEHEDNKKKEKGVGLEEKLLGEV